jgi:hypothetical protein
MKTYTLLIAAALAAMPTPSHASGALGSYGSGPGGSLTRVEQLWAKYLYQDYEVLEGNTAYNGPASKRTYRHLLEAIAAEEAGTPLPPIMGDGGQPIPDTKFTHGYEIPEVPDDLPSTMPAVGTYSAELEEQGDPEPPGDQPSAPPPAPVDETPPADGGETADTGEAGEAPSDGRKQDGGEGDGAPETHEGETTSAATSAATSNTNNAASTQ